MRFGSGLSIPAPCACSKRSSSGFASASRIALPFYPTAKLIRPAKRVNPRQPSRSLRASTRLSHTTEWRFSFRFADCSRSDERQIANIPVLPGSGRREAANPIDEPPPLGAAGSANFQGRALLRSAKCQARHSKTSPIALNAILFQRRNRYSRKAPPRPKLGLDHQRSSRNPGTTSVMPIHFPPRR